MQREWRVAIVEDEPIARLGLRRMLEAVPGATLVGEAASGPEAVRLLRETEPEIVFLDVNLPGGDAFDVLARASLGVPPATVLVTAFEEYAVRAFEVGVVDYLLKPFDERRFLRSWERAVSARLSATSADGRAVAPAEPRLLLRKDGRVHAVALAEVAWIEAADNYVRVHAAAGRFMWRTPLRQVAGRLVANGFVQISRSALVNLRYVEHLLPLDSGEGRVLLKGGIELQVSRRFRAAFQAALRGGGEPPR
ncbi:MAG TPA: LytTR family DNA-binding domain-containing protein [Longimicrobiaceae bacterium]|nr:LytTR family DNA-binding domain-containing protein [Longimicrobiaceae bacterium]